MSPDIINKTLSTSETWSHLNAKTFAVSSRQDPLGGAERARERTSPVGTREPSIIGQHSHRHRRVMRVNINSSVSHDSFFRCVRICSAPGLKHGRVLAEKSLFVRSEH